MSAPTPPKQKIVATSMLCCPLSSNKQHLSYDVCLGVRGEIIRTVLCCIVYWSCAQSWAHLDEQFLQFSGLGFCHSGPISLCVGLFLFIYMYFVFLPHCIDCKVVSSRERCPSVCLSVCLSVCASNAWIVTKRKKNLSRFLYRRKDHLA